VRVSLADLGYQDLDGYVMFPESTAVFDTGKRPDSFVHGGNSLQERVIPVLTVVHRKEAGGSTLQFAIAATAKDGVAGMHCLDVTVSVAHGSLDFGGAREVEIALRVPEAPDVQVELCQARGGRARLAVGAVQAIAGEPFELFFRLTGPSDTRVAVE